MLEIILILFIVALIIAGAVFLYFQYKKINADTRSRMKKVVDQINESQYYEYNFSKKQDENMQNLDKNLRTVYDNVGVLQNTVSYLQKTGLTKDELAKSMQTAQAMIGGLKIQNITIANGTPKNNIIIEAGRTMDGKNEGLSAINFNGYTQNGDKTVDPTKSRWRVAVDQTGVNDVMKIDGMKNGNLSTYLYMSDGTIGVNGNKLRFSDSYTGWSDGAMDQSEISNDTKSFKKLMIIGNKSSDQKTRKVGVWDRLDVHGNQGVDGTLSAENIQGRTGVYAGNGAAMLRNDGTIEGAIVKSRNSLCVNDVCMTSVDFNNLLKIARGGK